MSWQQQSRVRTVFGRVSVSLSRDSFTEGGQGGWVLLGKMFGERGLKLSQTNSKPFACKAKPYRQCSLLPCSGERSVAQREAWQPPGNASRAAWLQEGLYRMAGGAGLGETHLARASPSLGISSTEGIILSVVSPLREGQSNSGISIGGIFFTCHGGLNC